MDERYERRKEQSRRHEAKKTKAGQDIGPIPPPENLERKSAALSPDGFECFLLTYFPHRFTLPFCAEHKEVIRDMERAERDLSLRWLPYARGILHRFSAQFAEQRCVCISLAHHTLAAT